MDTLQFQKRDRKIRKHKLKKINIDKLGMCNTRVSDKKPGHALCLFFYLIYWEDFKNSFRHCKNRVRTLSAWKSSPISILEYFAGRNVYLFELFFITCIASLRKHPFLLRSTPLGTFCDVPSGVERRRNGCFRRLMYSSLRNFHFTALT